MSPATDPHSAAATKRLKKRETDRRCQREARQRVKSRVAHLEGLVEELRRKDTSGQVTGLIKQVAAVREERDRFARTLRGIQNSIQSESSLLYGAPVNQEPINPPTSTSVERESSSRDSSPARDPAPDQVASSLNGGSPAYDTATSFDDNELAQHSRALPSQRMQLPGAGGAPIDARCECCKPLATYQPPNLALINMDGREMWRYAHEVLKAPVALSPMMLQWEEEQCDDIPVRAVVEGWPAVMARLRGHLPPLWRKLRCIDEVMFYKMERVERLAALRIIYALLRYHAGPASQKAKVPLWPSQSLKHSYALNFFAWPGIRERFIFSQHAYCSNLFWYLHNTSIKVLWQYGFRDCYTINAHTGCYQISHAFEERIADIKAWTMGPAIFQKWPEFYSDIPSLCTVATPMDAISLSPGTRFASHQMLKPALLAEVVDEMDSDDANCPPHNQDPSTLATSHSPHSSTMIPDTPGGDLFRIGAEDGTLPMLLNPLSPNGLSKAWDVRSSDTIPEHDWLWLMDGLDNGPPEME